MTTARRSPRQRLAPPAAVVPWVRPQLAPAVSEEQRQRFALAFAARSPGTQRVYASHLDAFAAWLAAEEFAIAPALPEHVALFLCYRAAFCLQCRDQLPGGCGVAHHEALAARPLKLASLRVAVSAIAFLHRSLGLDDPTQSVDVRETLRLLARELGAAQGQAAALDVHAETAILAALDRAERAGRIPRERAARDRALLLTMRDALLRRAEAAALTWDDLEESRAVAGEGLVYVRRSKTDQAGVGQVRGLSEATWAALAAIRPPEPIAPGVSVFGIGARQIARRLRFLGELAGLPQPLGGHSPRVGRVHDLVDHGVELPALMQAGGWSTPQMVARYSERFTASKGASVALRRLYPASVRPSNGDGDGDGDQDGGGEGDGGGQGATG